MLDVCRLEQVLQSVEETLVLFAWIRFEAVFVSQGLDEFLLFLAQAFRDPYSKLHIEVARAAVAVDCWQSFAAESHHRA